MSDFSLSGISTQYDYSNKESEKTQALRDTLGKDFSSASKEELYEVCKDFESYFTEQVFKSMQKMIPEREEDSSSTSYINMFKDTLTQEYADLATESNNGDGLGIAQMLYEQMKRNYGIED